jgi:5'-nucleotidase
MSSLRLSTVPLILLAAIGCGGGGGAKTDAGNDAPVDGGTAQKLVILHTNDIHSHLMGFAPEADYTPATLNDDTTTGGMARLATAIGTAKAAAGTTPVLLLDGGDFMMGTLFELLATADPPELKFMKALGYDATTIGNHELDWTPTGLAGILSAAGFSHDGDGGMTPRDTVPIIASNMNFNDDADGGAGDDSLKALITATGIVKPKLIKTVGSLKVGFFGLLGADAVQVTPQAAPLTFTPIKTAAAAMVDELRNTDHVDLVIALSHSGIDHNGMGEDADLAAAVPGIDIIISGHTHDKLDQPKIVQAADGGTGQTIIVTAGAYGQYLGNMQLSVVPPATPGGRATVTVDNYVLQPIDDKIMGDGTTQTGVDTAIAGVDVALTGTGLTYKAPVAETAADLTQPTYAESTIGNLVTDSYRKVTAALQPTAPPVVAVEANGQIRAPIIKGKTGQIWLADLFRVLPIGIGPDQKPGYPLVTFYLNAKDIQSGLELDAAGAAVNDQYFLQVSGVKVAYDMTRPLFGRVTTLSLVADDGTVTPLDPTNTTTCYKVVATNYVAGLLGLVKTLTQGLLKVEAKASDCATLIDPTQPANYVNASTTGGTAELKHWQALLQYVSMFPDTDANQIKNVPPIYNAVQGRITHP